MGKIVKSNLSNVKINVPQRKYNFFENPVKAIVETIDIMDGDLDLIDYDKLISKIENIDNYIQEGPSISIFDYALDDGETGASGLTPTNSGASANIKNGNTIDASQPLSRGTKYNLSHDDIVYLAHIARKEQGSIEGAKVELSLMVNLYEKNKSKYSSVKDYVRNSGWFSHSKSSYSYPGDEYVKAAEEVVNNGYRYLSSNVVEHDCIKDITSVSTGSKGDRSSYIPGKTIIKNKYGAKYVFVGFAPNSGDPFGYLV